MGSCCSSDSHEEVVLKEAKVDAPEVEKELSEQFQIAVLKNLDDQTFREEVKQLRSFNQAVNVSLFLNQ